MSGSRVVQCIQQRETQNLNPGETNWPTAKNTQYTEKKHAKMQPAGNGRVMKWDTKSMGHMGIVLYTWENERQVWNW